MVPSLPERGDHGAVKLDDLLDALSDLAFERYLELAGHLFRAPLSCLTLFVQGEAITKATFGVVPPHLAADFPPVRAALDARGSLVVEDLARDARFARHSVVTAESGVRFFAGVPLVLPDDVVGVLSVMDFAPRTNVGADDRRALEHLGALITRELELHLGARERERESQATAALLETLRDGHAVSEALLGVVRLMQSDLPPTDEIMGALELVSRVADVDWCNLTAVKDTGAWMEAVWTRDPSGHDVTRSIPARPHRSESAAWRVAETGEARYVTSYAQEPSANPAAVAAGIRSVAWLPLGEYDHTRYVVIFGRLHRERAWTPRDKRLLEAAAHSIRHAMAARERTRRMQDAALTDPLTHLGNRRAFDEWLHASQPTAGACLLTIDVDGVEHVNDTLGRTAGDAMLRVFSTALAEHLPPNAKAYRFDSANFMVVFADIDSIAALRRARAAALAQAAVAADVARSVGFDDIDVACGVSGWPYEASMLLDAVRLAEARLQEEKRLRPTGKRAERDEPFVFDHPRDLNEAASAPTLQIGGLSVNLASRLAQRGSVSVQLSPKELVLLETLARSPGRVFSQDTLNTLLRGTNVEGSNALAVHVTNLRRKLGKLTSDVTLQAVRGAGYTLNVGAPSD